MPDELAPVYCSRKCEELDELDNVRIFSGSGSVQLWEAINDAKTVEDLRQVVYLMGCYLQRLESKVDE